MGILDSITSPRDLRDLDDAQLEQLASEIQEAVKQPFEKDGDEQDVTDVLFTSFIIQ